VLFDQLFELGNEGEIILVGKLAADLNFQHLAAILFFQFDCHTNRCFCCLDFSVFGIAHMGGFQGRNLGQTAAMPLRAGESCGEESLDVFPC